MKVKTITFTRLVAIRFVPIAVGTATEDWCILEFEKGYTVPVHANAAEGLVVGRAVTIEVTQGDA